MTFDEWYSTLNTLPPEDKDKKPEGRKKKSNKVVIVLLIIAMCITGFFGYRFIKDWLELLKSRDTYSEIADRGNIDKDPYGCLNQLPDYKAALTGRAVNDVVGWIYIPSTDYSYPVMYTPDNYQYYLRKDPNGNYRIAGTPFIDINNTGADDNNVLIYGHNMYDLEMFGTLKRYLNKDYWEDNKYIRFDTLKEIQYFEVMGIMKTNIDTDRAYSTGYWNYAGNLDEKRFNEYVDLVKKHSVYDTGVTAKYGDKLITLSCCADHIYYSSGYTRTVVVAKKVPLEDVYKDKGCRVHMKMKEKQ